MEINGTIQMPASCDILWQYLNDPTILKQCIPGCEQIDKISETDFTTRSTIQIGLMKVSFNARITLCDLIPPTSYRLIVQGSGGHAGFAKGEATVELIPQDNTITTLRYHAKGQVGGKILQLGARLIEATANKLADQFFQKLNTLLTGQKIQEIKPKSRRKQWIWIIVTAGIMIGLFFLYQWLIV